MTQAEIDAVGARLRARGIDCARERFRLPSPPRLSAPAALLACAAASFLLVSGHAAAAFLLASSGTILLLLDACGFSPLDWLGPKERRQVLVVQGTPSGETGKALLFAVPARCRLTGRGCFSLAEAAAGAARAAGLVLCLALCAASGAVLLVILPAPGALGTGAGVALLALAGLACFPSDPAGGPQNLAAGWVDRLVEPTPAGLRPFLLVYSGDEGEVKYFLARHRGPVFRGAAVFLEFAAGASGPPGMSGKEGPLLPYRVDAGLAARVREAGDAAGIPGPSVTTVRCKSPALVAMSRGFRAITLFRSEGPAEEGKPYSEDAALRWARQVADRFRPRDGAHAGRSGRREGAT